MTTLFQRCPNTFPTQTHTSRRSRQALISRRRLIKRKLFLHNTQHWSEFVDGDGFPYLGRSYRMELIDAQDVPLKVSDGCFRLRHRAVDGSRGYLVRWYAERSPEKWAAFVDEPTGPDGHAAGWSQGAAPKSDLVRRAASELGGQRDGCFRAAQSGRRPDSLRRVSGAPGGLPAGLA